MDKILVILLFGILFLIPLISSTQIYQKETDFDLKVPCFNNDTYCSPASLCNVTIISFNGSSIIDNLEMTYNIAFHNYTLNRTQTTESGEYTTSVICNDNGVLGYSTYNFIITPTGKSLSTSSAIVQGLILIVMFAVTIFFLIFSYTTDSPGIKLFFNMLSYITLFLTVGTGYIILQSSEVQGNLSFTVEALLFILGIVLVFIMFYIMIVQTIRAIQLMRIKKGFGSEYDNPQLF